MSSVPARQHPHFDQWALAQLRLYKPHRSIHELSNPSIASVFDAYVASGGFPNLVSQERAVDAQFEPDEVEPPREMNLLEPTPSDTDIQQDDYHELMNIGRKQYNCLPLLGARELDIIHRWPRSWHGFSFDTLVSWIVDIQKDTVLPPHPVQPLQVHALSPMQRLAFDIVLDHCFGPSQNEQLLMIVIGTAGTGKSFLISAIRSLFAERSCTTQIKVTAPTGIAAANISGSTIHSLLALLNATLTSQKLVALQKTMRNVRLLIIDEFSFLSAAVFDTLDRHLRLIFPHSHLPFGGLNIVLCGDPAQLPPVRAQPVYAHRGPTAHLAARFHLFDRVVELDQPFRQAGGDATQCRFRQVLKHIANSDATEDDWNWLQSRRACCLNDIENKSFDDCKYIVANNKIRSKINYDKLSRFSPIMKIEHSADGVRLIGDHMLDGERMDDENSTVFAVGADVILLTNLWTETGLVNGAYGTVDAILKPADNSKTRVLMVNFPNYHGPSLSFLAPTVVPITQIRSPHFTGLPLSLSWAITIHKSQGMSMDRVTIDLGDTEFAAGMTFVALSRAKRFDGLRVVSFDFNRYRGIQNGTNVQARREEFARLRALAADTLALYG
jgi:ATP-dependent DNA helicase PIF1